MNWLYATITVIIILLSFKIFFQNRKTNRTKEQKIIYLPYNLTITGAILLLFSGISLLFIIVFVRDSFDKSIAMIVFFGLALMSLMFVWIDNRYKIFIHESHMIRRTLLREHNIPYDKIMFYVDLSKIVIEYDTHKFYVSLYYPNVTILLDMIENYFHDNDMKNRYDPNHIQANFYMRNFGIAFVLISIINAIVSLNLYLFNESTNEMIFALIFMLIFAVVPFLVGVLFLLLYMNLKINISHEKMEFINLFGRCKTFKLKELTIQSTPNGVKVYNSHKKIIYLNYYFFINVMTLETKIDKSR